MDNFVFNSEKIATYIVDWLREYAQKARVEGFVVGVSGGIDSALVSTLCAMTGMKTLCVELPIHQAENQVLRAKEQIALLKSKYPNVESVEVDLTDAFDVFSKSFPTIDNEQLQLLTLANTRSRLRMTALYYFAGIHRLLVAGTGNKIEDFGVGFFTKYGDGGVDLSPIADLMKSEVRMLAKYIEVPQSILEAKPTDGLFGDDRSDEDQLGASYDELEWAMRVVENNQTEGNFTERQQKVLEIYTRLNRLNQHKMHPIPVCLVRHLVK